MSRRVIIGILIFLILGILGGTVALVIQRLSASNTSTETTNEPGASLLPTAEDGSAQLADPAGDTDGDGLSNGDELKWGANLNNPDTDSDGFKDGEEVIAGHNPTIAGPNDAIPAGFKPGEDTNEQKPLAIADVIDVNTPTPLPADLNPTPLPLAVDQYFETQPTAVSTLNLTEQYYRQYNTTTITSSVVQFLQTQPINTKLPKTYDTQLKPAAAQESYGTIHNYINTAFRKSALSDRNTIKLGLNILFSKNDPQLIESLIFSVEEYQKELIALTPPVSAVSTHRFLVGYSELLRKTLQGIMTWDTDRVNALLYIKQLDTIDRLYYPLIEQEQNRLDKLYL